MKYSRFFGNKILSRNCKSSESRMFQPLVHNFSSYSFASPRKLEEIMKTEKMSDMDSKTISEVWSKYHENKKRVVGLEISGKEGKSVLSRAAQCPYFIHPVFRDGGFFNLVSQFQTPSHFMLAYLEDYKKDPQGAQPLITLSLFENFMESHELTLVRGDIIAEGLSDEEGGRIIQTLVDMYRFDDEFTNNVHSFNKQPEKFDIDDFTSIQNKKWKEWEKKLDNITEEQ
eukprot:CAMPEP_0194357168 /NCGR_PEP_ID=MMETSP0174-20130528/4692_1 /TAXON_ID=216777 /ORGANISM="Proboscia alata, Strain PI-D3" /LENGTH=227 /DNA_ID=CAMNT_0039127073 /DNA_START=22 /DNA_END=705 /DNA_ORIENTATION=-